MKLVINVDHIMNAIGFSMLLLVIWLAIAILMYIPTQHFIAAGVMSEVIMASLYWLYHTGRIEFASNDGYY